MDMKAMSQKEYSLHCVEMTRRELMALLARTELVTQIGYRLGKILENAVNQVEALAEEAEELDYEQAPLQFR